jgi:hypothetical protein
MVAFGLMVSGAAALAQTTPAPPVTAYAWADSCKTCHEPVYVAWAKTKHASALNRLSAAEQEKECVGCHLTGPKTKVIDANKVLNQGVQCESCHGAAAAHVKDPAVRTGLTKMPPASLCEECHSDKSPHFKGFFYSAMAGLSHKVQ